ncbi:complex I NDUFA9 subunit family protein [Brytella acorum]|uniref:Complex I NDUFA9 subunit family protein n=1 Tax=Brytella acorum TaxID=2959299 RepID=A0AA35V9C1_9PROT|nr:complex I NDUFA9 subunit family protein [Brytella acorum]MDF3625204.1 complex I NDUFA9 subunit family protein [Brytella acorum]CAI9119384.1 complex I NDUFA9 subunit family protein [Brytella acorum]
MDRVATIVGGAGFIGRHVVEALVRRGYVVRVASRRPDRMRRSRRFAEHIRSGHVVPVYASLVDEPTLDLAIDGAEVVVNLVSILTETGDETFQAINAQGAGRVADVAARHDVSRYVHVSAIGADVNAKSHYGTSKAEGELAVRRAMPRAAIIRPSVVFGPGDHFLTMFAMMARFLPILPVVSGGTRFQPVYVGDVAEAIARLADSAQESARTVEAGGPNILTMREIMRFVLDQTGRQRRLFDLPMPLARLQATVLERLPGKLLTNDQLNMMRTDNIVSPGAMTLQELEIRPSSLSAVAPRYLRRKSSR